MDFMWDDSFFGCGFCFGLPDMYSLHCDINLLTLDESSSSTSSWEGGGAIMC